MRLSLGFITAALLSTTQAASYLSANQPCGNNKECETNCGKATYHIAVSDKSTYFACSFDGNALYGFGGCSPSRGSAETFSQSQLNGVCEAAAGQNCRAGTCTFLQANRDDYLHACTGIGGHFEGGENLSYEKAMSKCNKKV
ncbi:hypothetical protein PENNAL_c0206G05501 [Penicillium nalgiovense]|uniref:Uncharacterized protein n=1 Tax=Penicillium nalgiovense TaxID=60175 RepID=A0A1V6WRE4_PENNA|nr:hypothetical protein HAV15_012250 [Penicillium sp. str. \